MPDLLIRIKKKNDGSAALSCTRTDGSVTWQQQNGQQGNFFPLHDLTHYAVEQSLGFERAFFGLLAEGWDVSDFGKGGSKGAIPEQAEVAELIVGFLDLERANGQRWTAEDLNEKVADWYTNNDRPVPGFRMSDAQLTRIREVRASAFDQWKALPQGDTLEIPFERNAQSVV